MPKYIHAYDHIPVITGDEISFLRAEDYKNQIQAENPGLELLEDQPLPMEDALNESIRDISYKAPDDITRADGYESGELSNEENGSDTGSESESEKTRENKPEEVKEKVGFLKSLILSFFQNDAKFHVHSPKCLTKIKRTLHLP